MFTPKQTYRFMMGTSLDNQESSLVHTTIASTSKSEELRKNNASPLQKGQKQQNSLIERKKQHEKMALKNLFAATTSAKGPTRMLMFMLFSYLLYYYLFKWVRKFN